MRDDVWTLVRFLHVLGAACWVGGMIVLGAVAVPAALSEWPSSISRMSSCRELTEGVYGGGNGSGG